MHFADARIIQRAEILQKQHLTQKVTNLGGKSCIPVSTMAQSSLLQIGIYLHLYLVEINLYIR